MTNLVTAPADKATTIAGEAFPVEFVPRKVGAKMFPATAMATKVGGCSRTGCTVEVTQGQAVKVHPVSGRVFHEVADCSGTLTKDLPKAPSASAALALQVAELQAELAKLRAATTKVTKA